MKYRIIFGIFYVFTVSYIMLINRNYCCRNIYSVVFGTDFMYILMETFTEYFKLVKNIYAFHI